MIREEIKYKHNKLWLKDQLKKDYYKNIEKKQEQLNQSSMKQVWKFYNARFKSKKQN